MPLQHDGAHLDAKAVIAAAAPLDYAPRSLRPRHSFFSLLSLIMAGVSVVWLGFILFRYGGGTPHYRIGDPLWCALYDTYQWPGEIGVGLAVLGILQNGRKRTLSFLAIGIIVAAYVALAAADELRVI